MKDEINLIDDEFIVKLKDVKNFINYNVENSQSANEAISTIDKLIDMRTKELQKDL